MPEQRGITGLPLRRRPEYDSKRHLPFVQSGHGDGLHHNGKLVVGEALGDLGGLTLAYKAYKRSLWAQHGSEWRGNTKKKSSRPSKKRNKLGDK